jgi:hypothetical protein
MHSSKTKQPSPSTVRSSGRYVLVACIAILAVAAAVRIAGAMNDLWMDEIWSLTLAAETPSPLAVFTQIHHDNNNYINTLYLYFLGYHGNWPGYRALSLAAGIAAVAVAGLIGRRRNATSGLLAMLLVAFSYVQILYSSETRGYACVVLFSLLSFYLLDRYLERPSWKTAVLFSASTILGIMSHLSFVALLCASITWSVYRLLKDRAGLKGTALAVLATHAAPVLFLGLLYFIDIRFMKAGGGSRTTLIDGYRLALSWAFGAPPSDLLMFATSVIALLIFIAGLALLWRERSDWFVFFLGMIFVFPILLTIVYGSDYIYVRHFIIAITFLLILAGFVLDELWRRGLPGKAVCVLLLLAYFAANGPHVASLLTYGRGHYDEAVRFLIAHSNRPLVTVGGDHDTRVLPVLVFYAKEAAGRTKVAYYKQDIWPPEGPEWLICHKKPAETRAPPDDKVRAIAGDDNPYELVKAYSTAPLSGLQWFLYHNRLMGPIKEK